MSGVKRTRVFLAAPLFSEAERNFNSLIAESLRQEGYIVWLAQETTLAQEAGHKDNQKVYETNISMLKESDVVVAILDGLAVDAGVAYEMGFAKALNKPIIGLRTDLRVFSKIHEINLMLGVPLVKVCRNVDEVIGAIEEMI